MVDTSDDVKPIRRRVEIRTGVERRRRWTAEAKGRIVAEAVGPGAVIADVARRHEMTPQHLSNWIRAAKEGRFALPGDETMAFVPVVMSVSAAVAQATSSNEPPIEIAIGSVVVRVANGVDAARLEVVIRAVRRAVA